MANAPQAIWNLYYAVTVAGKRMGGIVGDRAHSFGYHLARNELSGNDYSVVLPLDRRGSSSSASALDLSLPQSGMRAVTTRLLNAAKKHDVRLKALREFCGTTDGYNTHPYDLAKRQDGPLNSWDSSHLSHVHLSFYRAYANNYAAIKPIADVINGKPTVKKDWFSMATEAQLEAVVKRVVHERLSWWLPRAILTLRKGTGNMAFNPNIVGKAVVDNRGVEGVVTAHSDDTIKALSAQVKALSAQVAAIKTKVGA